MDGEQLKNLLKRYRLSPNFTYGQNFLIDEDVLSDMADVSGTGEGDCVLEIGPGIGNLTEELLKRAKLVLSLEKDPKFLPVLRSLKKKYKNFRYEIADALEYDFQEFFRAQGCGSYKVVANIPYYITGKILQMLMTAAAKPQDITVLTQKEVAQNIVAGPGDLSVLAISVQIFGKPELKRIVPAKSFFPAPKVDSAILHIKLDKRSRLGSLDEKKFFRVLRACFAGKRKQIHNTLKNNLKLPPEEINAALAKLQISSQARPQELTIENWIELAMRIGNYSN